MTITSFLDKLDSLILNPLILLLFAVSTVYFIYGVVKYLSMDPSDNKSEARDAIIWGLVGMLIMFSVYGIIRFVLATFGITGTVPFISSKLQ